jgi:hypothetical protein
MPKVGETELRRWRELPAAAFLSQFAEHAKRDLTFIPIKNKTTQRWNVHVAGRDYELLTEGVKFYDTRTKQGGGGAVDLVMYLYRLDFSAATGFLRRHNV